MIGSCGAVVSASQQKEMVDAHMSNSDTRIEFLKKIESVKSGKTEWSQGSSSLLTGHYRNERPVAVAMMRMMPQENDCPMLFPYRMRVFGVICWYPFDYFVGIVILMNAATVGIEQTLRYENGDTTIVDVLERCFFTVYLVELGMRVFACGVKCFSDNYVRFDIALVALGLLSLVADALLVNADQLGPLLILRTGRLLRLARTARLLIKFRELWIMVRGLMTSLGTIIYTMLLLFLILYTFSCISMEVITPLHDSDNIAVKEIVSAHFSNLPQTMLTFLQFVCLDSVADIYRPLIEHQPLLVFFFVTFIVVVPIVLMNLVTAVVVNGALENAQQDKDALAVYERQQKQRLIVELRKVFERIDEDGSGMLSPKEILRMSGQDLDLLRHLTCIDEPMDIVHILDVDGDGGITIDEFLNGLWQVVISKVPAEMRIELKRMQKEAKEQAKQIREALEKLEGHVVKLTTNTKVSAMLDTPSPCTIPVTDTAECTIVEQSPAWAQVMISELRAFRRDCSGSLVKAPHASYDAVDSLVDVDCSGDSSPAIVTSLSATIRQQFTWARSNVAECSRSKMNPETFAHEPLTQEELPMLVDTSGRSDTSKMDHTSSRMTSMRNMVGNGQASDIENQMVEI